MCTTPKVFYGKSGFVYASNYGIRYHGLPEGEDAGIIHRCYNTYKTELPLKGNVKSRL